MNLSNVRYIDAPASPSLVEGLKASRDLNLRFHPIRSEPLRTRGAAAFPTAEIFEVYDNEDQALSFRVRR